MDTLTKEENAVPLADNKFDPPLYKEWFRTRSAAGFISIDPWLTDRRDGSPVGRLVIDIGSVDSSDKVTSSTKCYVNAVDLAIYLRAITLGKAADLYPKRSGTNSPESFIMFGGTPGENPVARVFKIEHWGATKDSAGDPNGFVWKCGHFKGTVTDSGAIQPNYSEPLSGDMIKRTRLQMFEISYKLDLELQAWASRTPCWYGK